MNIDYTVAALMFPAMALIMGVYNTRFHTLSALIRKLHDEYVFQKHIPPEWKKQLKNLSRRSVNLKYAIGSAGLAFLFDMLTVFALYLDLIFYARLIFGLCCLSLFLSIVLYLGEIFVSTRALKLHLSDMKIDED
tara:strand:- start:1080 stop:1484 length:405 start_codon:yes stop_codon:yes gene_type:complete